MTYIIDILKIKHWPIVNLKLVNQKGTIYVNKHQNSLSHRN